MERAPFIGNWDIRAALRSRKDLAWGVRMPVLDFGSGEVYYLEPVVELNQHSDQIPTVPVPIAKSDADPLAGQQLARAMRWIELM
jgi:hypothetical protein